MGDKKKVLVVDDNHNFNQLLQCALEDDFEFFSAADGREGLKESRRDTTRYYTYGCYDAQHCRH